MTPHVSQFLKKNSEVSIFVDANGSAGVILADFLNCRLGIASNVLA